MKMKKILVYGCILMAMLFMFAGCGNQTEQMKDTNTVPAAEEQSLFVYCGAGMKTAAQQVIDTFEAKTGITVEVTYANAANIISQITAAKEGDVFIAGDMGELAKLEEQGFIADTVKLVKHIPVLAVQTGNPKKITGLRDLANQDIKVVLGDNQATPIGKLSDKALREMGVLDSLNIAARTTTASEITTALTLGQCDAAINWKESTAGIEGVEIVETTDLDKYVKKVPAASLTCSVNEEARLVFIEFLKTDEAKTIWQNNGYEIIEE
jgi:molybdate transport system substrate-binding protein